LISSIPVFVIADVGDGRAQLQSEVQSDTPWAYYQANIKSWEEQEAAFTQAVEWMKTLGVSLGYVFANAGIGERKWLDLLPDSSGMAGTFQRPNFEVCEINW